MFKLKEIFYFSARIHSDALFMLLLPSPCLMCSSCWSLLLQVYHWLQRGNLENILKTEMTSNYFQDPINVDGEWNKFLGQLDYGFTFIFAIEVLLKILDYGLVLHPGSYLREMWNCMDLIVVSCAITSFTMDMM